MRVCIVVVLNTFLSCGIWAQKSLLFDVVSLSNKPQTVEAFLLELEQVADIQITFSPSQIDLKKRVKLNLSTQDIAAHLKAILKGQAIRYQIPTKSIKRIVLVKDPKLLKRTIKGLIIDELTGDPLIGVLVRDKQSNNTCYSDDNGFFRISTDIGNGQLEFSLLGFETKIKNEPTFSDAISKVTLDFDNYLPDILITGSEIKKFVGIPGENIYMRNISSYTNFLGENNVMEEIKTSTAIQSGNEGEIGFLARGGSSDQNLVLYEGVPMYVTDHTAGLSSIFVADAVKDAVLYTDEFPLKYGGRLSSVLDIKLKNGKRDKTTGTINTSITGSNLFLSGPLSDKLSYNISGRLSWIDLYIDPILKRSFNYEDSQIAYQDFSGKLFYQIDPVTQLSITGYTGNDILKLQRTSSEVQESKVFEVGDLNQIEWSSKFLALNFQSFLNSNWIFKSHLSAMNYKHISRGNYFFNEFDAETNDTLRFNNLDILSYSEINDVNAYADLQYVPNEKIQFNLGGGRLIHKFTPTIRQETTESFQDFETIVNGDSSLVSSERYLYAELISTPSKYFKINAGFRTSNYSVRNKTHSFTEPRINFNWKPRPHHAFNLSYNQMVQYVHRLVNPSGGLPADLWVPSTENILPEFATHFSFRYTYQKRDFKLSFAAYQKSFDQLLDYTNSFDLFLAVLNQGNFVPVYNTSNEWERRVSTGTGISRGLELYLAKSLGESKFRLSYALSRTTRTFEDINEGKEFPFRFDRTHDLNFSFNTPISDKWDFAMRWIYGTGNTLTLAIEQFRTPEGLLLLNANGRNNYRLVPFHHLDLHVNRIFKIRKMDCRMSLGLYNAYNRLNPVYAFLYLDPNRNDLKIRQVSLFPIIPHLGFTASW